MTTGSKKSESSNPSKGQTVYPSIDHVLGTHNQSRKVGINPCSNICVRRDGIPHSGKHCQNSSRQSSKCSRFSELVSETIISFSRVFLTLLWRLNATAQFVILGRLHLRPLQMTLFAQWKLQVLLLTHKILISHQIKHHLKRWTNRDRFIQVFLSSQFRKRRPSWQAPVSRAGVLIWNRRDYCFMKFGQTNLNSISMSSKKWLFPWLWKEHIM